MVVSDVHYRLDRGRLSVLCSLDIKTAPSRTIASGGICIPECIPALALKMFISRHALSPRGCNRGVKMKSGDSRNRNPDVQRYLEVAVCGSGDGSLRFFCFEHLYKVPQLYEANV